MNDEIVRDASQVAEGERIVTTLAKGYQDPHFVDPKPSFILAVSRADLLVEIEATGAHALDI